MLKGQAPKKTVRPRQTKTLAPWPGARVVRGWGRALPVSAQPSRVTTIRCAPPGRALSPKGSTQSGMSAPPVYSKQPKSGICSSIQDTLSRAGPTHSTAQAAGPSQPRGLQNGTKASFQSEKCLPLPTVLLIRSREAQLKIQATHKRELKVSNQQKHLSYSASTSLTPSPPSCSMKGHTHERTLPRLMRHLCSPISRVICLPRIGCICFQMSAKQS